MPLCNELVKSLVAWKDGELRGYNVDRVNTSLCITREVTIEREIVLLIKAYTKTCDGAQVTLGRPECTRHD